MEREHITPQGVSIFHDKNENIHSFCLCLYVRAGSLFETKENNGISHFFEQDDRLRRNALAAPRKAELLLRRRLDADGGSTEEDDEDSVK